MKDRDQDRLNSIGRTTGISNANNFRININFNNETSNSGLVGYCQKEESKMVNKTQIQPKKTLQTTNSTNLLDTMANAETHAAMSSSLNKGNQFFPNFRQKQ